MSNRSRFWLCRLAVCGVIAFAVSVVFVHYALSDGDETAPKSVAAQAAPEEQFDDPGEIAKAFVSKLGRLADKGAAISPAVLKKQLDTATHCTAAIVAEPTERLTAEAVYARARAGVVIIGAIPKTGNRDQPQGIFASGFVIGRDGTIVSNAHVIEAFQEMKAMGAMTSDGRVFPVKAVLAANRADDVAMLKIDASDLTALPIARSVAIGATVYCLSHPMMDDAGTEQGFFAFTQGIVSGRYRTRATGEAAVNVLTITADYAVGSSGGPILNDRGAVVGVVCQTLAVGDEDGAAQMTWKFARPASSVLALLRDARPAK